MTPLRGLVDPALAASWRARVEGGPAGSNRLDERLPLDEVWRALAALHAPLHDHLGTPARIVASQCWVRRADPPHHWHQDGALNHDFASEAAPLPMWTCWIALTPCGEDAPGLEWVVPSLPRLLAPAELTDEAVRARFAPAAFAAPRFEPGDALLFDGGLLHRTQRGPALAGRRTSIELRFVAAGPVPARLAGEQFRSTA